MGLKFNSTHQFLAYSDDVNLLGDNIVTLQMLVRRSARNKGREN
jgi:hypothetical protein